MGSSSTLVSPDIFVSYSRSDRAWVEPLVQALKASGHTVWWDHDLQAGQAFRHTIGQALEAAGCVLVVWSERAIHSDWVPTEADQALQRKVLVPVLMEPTKLPLPFGGLHTIDLQGWQGDRQDARFQALLQGIRTKLGVRVVPEPVDEADTDPTPAASADRVKPDKVWWQSLGRTGWQSLLVLFTVAGGIVALIQLYLWSAESSSLPTPASVTQSVPASALQLSYSPKGVVRVGDSINLDFPVRQEGFLSVWLQNPDDTVERLLPGKAGKQALALNPGIDRVQKIRLTAKGSGQHRFLLLWTAQDQPLVEYYPDSARFIRAMQGLPDQEQAELVIPVVP